MITAWVEFRRVDAVLEETGPFNGSDPLRPAPHQAGGSSQTLLSLKEWRPALNTDVVLREPLEEGLQEIRDWVASIPATPQPGFKGTLL